MVYYVATYRPPFDGQPFPAQGVKIAVYKAKDFAMDVLPAGLTSLWEVSHVKTKEDAIACILEYAAGKRVCVYRRIPNDTLV